MEWKLSCQYVSIFISSIIMVKSRVFIHLKDNKFKYFTCNSQSSHSQVTVKQFINFLKFESDSETDTTGHWNQNSAAD